MFMSDEELADLTGHRRHAKQSEWLRNNRIPFLIGGDGKPKVASATILAILGPAKHEPKGPQLRGLKNAAA